MNDEIDELMGVFAKETLEPQRGTLAKAFERRLAEARQGNGLEIQPAIWVMSRRWCWSAWVAAALVLVAGGLAWRFYRGHEPSAGTSAAVTNEPMDVEVATEECWYRDIPGPIVTLGDKTPAQLVYRQYLCVSTQANHETVSADAVPATMTFLVSRPTF